MRSRDDELAAVLFCRVRCTSVAAGVLVTVATIAVLMRAPTRVISVGDDASLLRSFKDHGYSESQFSVLPHPGPDGNWHTPRFFHLGNHWYIRVWHGDRIESITHFRAVPHEHAYADFVDRRELTSFTIASSSRVPPYFVGLAVLFSVGWAVHRRRTVYWCLLGVLFSALVLSDMLAMITTITTGSDLIFPVALSLGWLGAFILGANIFQPVPFVASSVIETG
jgi:hypothetical protein